MAQEVALVQVDDEVLGELIATEIVKSVPQQLADLGETFPSSHQDQLVVAESDNALWRYQPLAFCFQDSNRIWSCSSTRTAF